MVLGYWRDQIVTAGWAWLRVTGRGRAETGVSVSGAVESRASRSGDPLNDLTIEKR